MNYKKNILAVSILAATCAANANTSPEQNLVKRDPLTFQQWHLQNTGQTGFSLSSGSAGEDLNLDFADRMGIKGRGITVSVIDTGVEISHPDLKNNVVAGSKNLIDGSDYPVDTHGHGTAVAGLIAAEEGNNLGGRGVAPYANLIGFNFLSEQSVESWMLSHGLGEDFRALDRFTDPRVFNQSYGSTPSAPVNGDLSLDPRFALEETVMQDITLNSHWGRGSIYVKSAGNSFASYSTYIQGQRFLVLPYEGNAFFNNQGLPFHNANITPSNTTFWNLVVSSLNAEGKLASYSSVGSNVFLSSPGGEYGQDKPAMVTVDLTGCEQGMNVSGTHKNSLHGGSEVDPNCDFTGVMNGTSSAAPNTAGAIATVMSANPGLDARTVRHLLATTARKVDPQHNGVNLNFESATGEALSYDAIPGWQTNAAGYNFHNFYGLGAVNIDDAVYKALFTSVSLPELQITDWQPTTVNATIPDADLTGAQSTMAVAQNLTVEAVQLKVNIDHTRLRDLAIELTSPSGTRSVVMSARTGFLGGTDGGYTDAIMLSHHFYGEQSQGDWTIKVIDTDKGSSQTLIYNAGVGLFGTNSSNNADAGLLKDWSLRIYGH
ncbi:Microbial serine proteinase [Pseudoalteromonas holothuriae]|uniref:Microbial serine proteinase n=1 Tax=Pseudoalteromonas holothuriae TaxID=2963714 RepID=A0A9W4QUK8_9GAMM|nr:MULTISPECIES: S8 family peptidase [unclassified Pseudoalteromonas]CAH9053643.1 Microbial serine proteinase [Pseudoalteromonas sp. CIP111854]CAH9061179.1 Microbial serine proteinase [Pseudoalteromonas sp. CIP111951]